ncbi:MBL fold metallo-hydrolase [Brevundimonas intermedia]|uniref:MBL fold metallo-hydrolase n=1 Tax=Brevundimonas intermedia TaxID=74315 RepID=A0A4Y9RYI2_9CAUL|nr:MBL fold metallo-hydrolase [Brevundimonas intermedia]
MIVHHLNCGCDKPVGGAFLDGRSRGLFGCLVCHCLLIETATQGLVLVDTGYGLRDVRQPRSRISPLMLTLMNIQLREERTALRQIEALGYAASDVRHVVVTHLDFDHAGGLTDFPRARIHVTAEELSAARGGDGGRTTGLRYRLAQFGEVDQWRAYRPAGERWQGFEAVQPLEGLPDGILLVPLAGHTRGHAGVAVNSNRGWLLHAGDAYFHADEMTGQRRRCPPLLRAYQRLMEVDRRQRRLNQSRLRRLIADRGGEIEVFCSHDAQELARAKAASNSALIQG